MAGGKGKMSFGGRALPSWTAEMAAWVARYVPEKWLWEFAPALFPGARLTATSFYNPDQMDRPVEPGKLFWPVGASRFSVAHLISRDSDLALLRPLCYGAGTSAPQDLLIDDGTRTVTARMYLLPPRRLTSGRRSYQPGDLKEDAYLLTLVDQRFFWLGRNAGALQVTQGVTSWQDLYSAIGAVLGVTIHADAVSSDYLWPSGSAFMPAYESLPVLLDAVAFNSGARIVCDFDGTVHAYNLASSVALRDANLGLQARPVAGGPFLMGAVI